MFFKEFPLPGEPSFPNYHENIITFRAEEEI
jgi:hypothetical protein